MTDQRTSCHPENPYGAKGMCRKCYNREQFSDPAKAERHRRDTAKWIAENPEKAKETYRRYFDANREDVLRRSRDRRRTNPPPSASQNARFLRSYGITVDDRDDLIDSQKGLCAICGQPPMGKRQHGVLHVDHDHETGRVRAMLCSNCNLGLGKFKDDPDLLARAAQYVYMHKPLVAVA